MHDRTEAGTLAERKEGLRRERPDLRARDAAAELGVSEAEYVAASCGGDVRRLAGPWPELVAALPALGPVMALTRNPSAVHEKVGSYGEVSVTGNQGLVLTPDIDLRIFYANWSAGFAVTETGPRGPRQSLQFFSTDGTAIHKIYLRPESDAAAYEALVARHLSDDQGTAQAVTPRKPGKPERPDGEIDIAELRRRWDGLKDVHDFVMLLRDSGVSRLQAFRLVGRDYALPVPAGSFRRAVESAAETELPIMIFVGNPGVIQIHTGPVRTLKDVGPWFNVLDPGFNLHLRTDGIAEAWLVRKPTSDGIVTSLELFADDGKPIAYMFGARKPGQPELEAWRGLAASLEPVAA